MVNLLSKHKITYVRRIPSKFQYEIDAPLYLKKKLEKENKLHVVIPAMEMMFYRHYPPNLRKIQSQITILLMNRSNYFLLKFNNVYSLIANK